MKLGIAVCYPVDEPFELRFLKVVFRLVRHRSEAHAFGKARRDGWLIQRNLYDGDVEHTQRLVQPGAGEEDGDQDRHPESETQQEIFHRSIILSLLTQASGRSDRSGKIPESKVNEDKDGC